VIAIWCTASDVADVIDSVSVTVRCSPCRKLARIWSAIGVAVRIKSCCDFIVIWKAVCIAVAVAVCVEEAWNFFYVVLIDLLAWRSTERTCREEDISRTADIK